MRNQNRALLSGSAVQTVTAEKHHLLQGWHSFWKRSTTCFWTQSKTDKQCAKVPVFPQLNNCNLSAGNTIQSGNTISNPQLQKKKSLLKNYLEAAFPTVCCQQHGWAQSADSAQIICLCFPVSVLWVCHLQLKLSKTFRSCWNSHKKWWKMKQLLGLYPEKSKPGNKRVSWEKYTAVHQKTQTKLLLDKWSTWEIHMASFLTHCSS